MTKAQKIFAVILGFELILTIIAYFIADTCGSACVKPGFLNPLGTNYGNGICTMQCVQYQPGSLFYTLADLFILTLIGFSFSQISINRFLKIVLIATIGLIWGTATIMSLGDIIFAMCDFEKGCSDIPLLGNYTQPLALIFVVIISLIGFIVGIKFSKRLIGDKK